MNASAQVNRVEGETGAAAGVRNAHPSEAGGTTEYESPLGRRCYAAEDTQEAGRHGGGHPGAEVGSGALVADGPVRRLAFRFVLWLVLWLARWLALWLVIEIGRRLGVCIRVTLCTTGSRAALAARTAAVRARLGLVGNPTVPVFLLFARDGAGP